MINTCMTQYEPLLKAHNMVLFQGGLGGNFLSYLIAFNSLKLPLGNPATGHGGNEYSMTNAFDSADDPYCNTVADKTLILERHINLFFKTTTSIGTHGVYKTSRYHDVFTAYQDTKIIVITIDPTDIDLVKWLSLLMSAKAYYYDLVLPLNFGPLDLFDSVYIDNMSHYKWFISSAKMKNIDVLEVDYRQLFIDRDETVISELLKFPHYSHEFDLNKVCNEIAKYHQRNMSVIEEFKKILINHSI